MKTYLLLAVAAFLIAAGIPSFALEGSGGKITFIGAEVQLGDVAHTTLTVTFDQNSSLKAFSLPLFYEIQNLKADSNFGNVSCASQKKAFGSQIDCAISPTPEKRMLTLEFDSFDMIKRVDGRFLYKQEFHVPLETNSLSFKAILPEGMFLTSEGAFQQFLPLDGEKGSDGRKIFISWRKEVLAAGESFDTQVSYEALSDNSQMTALLTSGVFALGISIVLLVLGFWFFYKRFRKDVKIVLPVLKGDEKRIMEMIIRDKGNTNQKLLVRESNFSKARVSKILKSLQERGIVRLEREGRGNNVRLVKDFGKAKKENETKPSKEANMKKRDFRGTEKSFDKSVPAAYDKENRLAETEYIDEEQEES